MNLKNYNLPCCFITVIMSYSAAAAEGDIVTSPSYQLGLPDSKYRTVDGMITKCQGNNADMTIVDQIRTAELNKLHPNDLMHWYVTTPTSEEQKVECSGNGLRYTFATPKDSYLTAALVVWVPTAAKEVSVSFDSHSKGLSLAVYTFDYKADVLTHHWSDNNGFSNSHAPDSMITYTTGPITLQADKNKTADNYLIVLFNTPSCEETWLDINGVNVSFVPTTPLEDLIATASLEKSGYGVGYNIMSIPEPATTTLSLAALGMLAARRRRR